MITDLIAMQGIKLATDINMDTILTYWPNHIPDYGDAILAAQCKGCRKTAIATFDKKLKSAAATLGLPTFEF